MNRFKTKCVLNCCHVRLFAPLCTVSCQTPISMEFSRQESWSGLPFPPPGDLPKPGIKPVSPELADGFFTAKPPEKPNGQPTQIQNLNTAALENITFL